MVLAGLAGLTWERFLECSLGPGAAGKEGEQKKAPPLPLRTPSVPRSRRPHCPHPQGGNGERPQPVLERLPSAREPGCPREHPGPWRHLFLGFAGLWPAAPGGAGWAPAGGAVTTVSCSKWPAKNGARGQGDCRGWDPAPECRLPSSLLGSPGTRVGSAATAETPPPAQPKSPPHADLTGPAMGFPAQATWLAPPAPHGHLHGRAPEWGPPWVGPSATAFPAAESTPPPMLPRGRSGWDRGVEPPWSARWGRWRGVRGRTRAGPRMQGAGSPRGRAAGHLSLAALYAQPGSRAGTGEHELRPESCGGFRQTGHGTPCARLSLYSEPRVSVGSAHRRTCLRRWALFPPCLARGLFGGEPGPSAEQGHPRRGVNSPSSGDKGPCVRLSWEGPAHPRGALAHFAEGGTWTGLPG